MCCREEAAEVLSANSSHDNGRIYQVMFKKWAEGREKFEQFLTEFVDNDLYCHSFDKVSYCIVQIKALLPHLQFLQNTQIMTPFGHEGIEELAFRIAKFYPIMKYLEKFPQKLLAVSAVFVSACSNRAYNRY
jgi:hypothetical protein